LHRVISSYGVPERISFVEPLGKTGVGKMDKKGAAAEVPLRRETASGPPTSLGLGRAARLIPSA
jgi:hypothetical protein